MKKRKILLIAIISLIMGGRANQSLAEESISPKICDDYKLSIVGAYDVKQEHTNHYQLLLQNTKTSASYKFSSIEGAKGAFTIFQGGKQVNNVAADGEGSMFYAFPERSLYEIRGIIKTDHCFWESNKIIRAYNHMFLYIGDFLQDFNFGLQDNIQQNDNIVASIFTNDINEQEQEIWKTNANYMQQSNIIFINIANFSTIFETLEHMEDQAPLSGKKIAVVSDIDPVLVKKLLAPFVAKSQRSNIYIIKKKALTDFFLNLSIGKDVSQPEDMYALSSGKIGRRYSLGTLIDTLIYNGVPIDLMGLVLSLSLCVVLLVFIKQVIGIPGYGLYYPLLTGISLDLVGRKTSILFLCIGIFAHIITSLITQKINLLVYAKIGTYLITYIIVSFLGLSIFSLGIGESIDMSTASAAVILLTFLGIAMSGKKVFTESKSIKRIKRRIHIFWFCVLSYICMLIITSKSLQYQLLIQPEIIFAALIITILLGRFTGLQLTEYIRFWPLIRRQVKEKIKPKKKKK